MPERGHNSPLVVTLCDTLTPGLARAVVRNWWPWIKVQTAKDVSRSSAVRKRPLVVLLQSGQDASETAAIVRFFRAPWRQTPVVVIDDDGGCELSLRGEGVACFLSGSQVEPELIEELALSLAMQRQEKPETPVPSAAKSDTTAAKRLA